MSEVLDRITSHLVGLRMPRALEALNHTVQLIERGEITPWKPLIIFWLKNSPFAKAAASRSLWPLPGSHHPRPWKASTSPSSHPLRPRSDHGSGSARLHQSRRSRPFPSVRQAPANHTSPPHSVSPPSKLAKAFIAAAWPKSSKTLSKAEREGRLAEKLKFYAAYP